LKINLLKLIMADRIPTKSLNYRIQILNEVIGITKLNLEKLLTEWKRMKGKINNKQISFLAVGALSLGAVALAPFALPVIAAGYVTAGGSFITTASISSAFYWKKIKNDSKEMYRKMAQDSAEIIIGYLDIMREDQLTRCLKELSKTIFENESMINKKNKMEEMFKYLHISSYGTYIGAVLPATLPDLVKYLQNLFPILELGNCLTAEVMKKLIPYLAIGNFLTMSYLFLEVYNEDETDEFERAITIWKNQLDNISRLLSKKYLLT
jgi:hypothetical protein